MNMKRPSASAATLSQAAQPESLHTSTMAPARGLPPCAASMRPERIMFSAPARVPAAPTAASSRGPAKTANGTAAPAKPAMIRCLRRSDIVSDFTFFSLPGRDHAFVPGAIAFHYHDTSKVTNAARGLQCVCRLSRLGLRCQQHRDGDHGASLGLRGVSSITVKEPVGLLRLPKD